MKKTKWAAMAAAMLFLVSAYLGTSPALARYLNSEQSFTTHAAENRSLTVTVGEPASGNFLTSDGAAFLVTAPAGSTLPFTFTNDGSDAKVIRITSTTALGSSADEVFILNPSADIDQDKITDPVVSGTVSKYVKSHTIDWTLAAGIYTVSIEVFEARDVKLTGAKDDTTDPATPENPDSSGDSDNSGGNTGDNTGDNTGSGETDPAETENTPAAQSAAPAVPTPTAEMTENEENSESEKNGDNSGSGEDGTTPTTPSDPITPAGDSNSSIEEGSAKPYITLRAVFVVQIDGSAPSVTVAPLLTITGNEHSINGTNQLSVAADAAVSGYSVQRYVELEQKGEEVDTEGKPVIMKVLQWQTVELTVPEEGTTEIPAIKGFTAELKEKTLTLTNAESQAPAGLYRLVINLNDTTDFPLYVPFLVNYRQAVLQDAQEETPTVVI